MSEQHPSFSSREPVAELDTGSVHTGLTDGMALALSGGGYRAMLFHGGALWRLYEAGLLNQIEHISNCKRPEPLGSAAPQAPSSQRRRSTGFLRQIMT